MILNANLVINSLRNEYSVGNTAIEKMNTNVGGITELQRNGGIFT